MGLLQKMFGKYLPDDPAEKAQVGSTVSKLKTVHEFLADLTEAVEDLDVVEAIGRASPWAEAVGKSLGDALPPVRFALKLFAELGKVDDPGELGYLAATLAFQRSVEQALTLNAFLTPDKTVREASVRELRRETPPEEYDFTRFSFGEALDHPFVKDAEKYLSSSARALGLDDSDERELLNQVRIRFVPNLKGILSHGSTRERFAPFRDLMTIDTAESRAYSALLEHIDYQRWLFEEKPVLGTEPFTLRDVYVDTDCGIKEWREIKELVDNRVIVDLFAEEHGGRQPILETILALLGDPDFRDAIVLQGVAGSGKSALTLRLAWELVRLGLRPIRIELKHLDTREAAPIDEALPEAVQLTETDRCPDANRLNFGKGLFLDDKIFNESVGYRQAKICPYVLILDGWDEISVGASEGYQQQVARMLDSIRRRYLEQRAFPVRVLLTGRPTEAVENSKFLRGETRILTIRNFTPEQLALYVAHLQHATSQSNSLDSQSTWNLGVVDGIPSMLDRYAREFQQQRNERNPFHFSNGSLEILGLPLLAHLALRLLAQHPDSASDLLENTTTLYRNLVDLVVGAAGKPPEAAFDPTGTAMISGNRLRKLLRMTAEAMTTLAEETISHDELAVRLQLEETDLGEEVDALASNHLLSGLVISFFFKGGRPEVGAEFSHKSFREFLVAEQLVEVLKDYGRNTDCELVERDSDHYWKEFDPTDPRAAFCHRLARTLGPVWLSPEVADHVRRLLEWEISQAATEPYPSSNALDLASWCRIREGLADAWDWWAEGVHLRPQPIQNPGYRDYDYPERPVALRVVEDMRLRSLKHKRPTPARTTTVDGHLGEGLFLLTAVTHSAIALRAGWRGFLAEKDHSGTSTYHRRYQNSVEIEPNHGPFVLFAPSGRGRSYFFNYCARINAAGYRPIGPFPLGAHLRAVDLELAYLGGLDFRLADFVGASLSRTFMMGADLGSADLRGASLIRADLRGSNLDGAALGGSSLACAILRACSARAADFTEADLRSADLSYADLSEVTFESACLAGANLLQSLLYRANLRKASLESANCRGAIFREADFADANLTGAQLDRADFSDASNVDESYLLELKQDYTGE